MLFLPLLLFLLCTAREIDFSPQKKTLSFTLDGKAEVLHLDALLEAVVDPVLDLRVAGGIRNYTYNPIGLRNHFSPECDSDCALCICYPDDGCVCAGKVGSQRFDLLLEPPALESHVIVSTFTGPDCLNSSVILRCLEDANELRRIFMYGDVLAGLCPDRNDLKSLCNPCLDYATTLACPPHWCDPVCSTSQFCENQKCKDLPPPPSNETSSTDDSNEEPNKEAIAGGSIAVCALLVAGFFGLWWWFRKKYVCRKLLPTEKDGRKKAVYKLQTVAPQSSVELAEMED